MVRWVKTSVNIDPQYPPPENLEMAPNRMFGPNHDKIRIPRWISDTTKSTFMYN